MNRLECRTFEELAELLAYVSVSVPDMFPDDEDAEGEPQNMEEAFIEIYAAVDDLVKIDSQHIERLRDPLANLKEAESHSLQGNYKECITLLDRARKILRSGGAGKDEDVSAMSPRDQGNFLLNKAINLSEEMISRDGSHIPFAFVLLDNCEVETVLVDDTETQDQDILTRSLFDAICARSDLLAVAFSTNMDYQEEGRSARTDAIIVDLDHKMDRASTCILQYELGSVGELTHGQFFAVKARRTFFSPREKLRTVD